MYLKQRKENLHKHKENPRGGRKKSNQEKVEIVKEFYKKHCCNHITKFSSLVVIIPNVELRIPFLRKISESILGTTHKT